MRQIFNFDLLSYLLTCTECLLFLSFKLCSKFLHLLDLFLTVDEETSLWISVIKLQTTKGMNWTLGNTKFMNILEGNGRSI